MTYAHAEEAIDILLVEDNPGDVRLIVETFHEGQIRNHMSVVPDGIEALAFLRREGSYNSATRPRLILLDLNLPRKGGQEVLLEVKQDPELKRIPVVVLTSSRAERDILDAYNNHANCYLTKPVLLEQFMNVIRSVQAYWLGIASLPPQ